MTILCALFDQEANELWLGCNDRATIGDTPAPSPISKWLTFDEWAIGLSGNESVYELFLRLAGESFPRAGDILDVFQFLRKTFDDYGLGQQKSGDTSLSYGVDGIIAHKSGRIWDFDNQLALSEVPAGRLWACGSGVDYALGADFVAARSGKSPHERMGFAIGAAIALDIACPGDAIIGRFTGGDMREGEQSVG
ncbi:MAG: hypothetical protein AAGB02_03405 [Pseudomonadota bacterium]